MWHRYRFKHFHHFHHFHNAVCILQLAPWQFTRLRITWTQDNLPCNWKADTQTLNFFIAFARVSFCEYVCVFFFRLLNERNCKKFTDIAKILVNAIFDIFLKCMLRRYNIIKVGYISLNCILANVTTFLKCTEFVWEAITRMQLLDEFHVW